MIHSYLIDYSPEFLDGMVLKEAVVAENTDTRNVFQTRFVPKGEKDRLDRELQNKELPNLAPSIRWQSTWQEL